MTKKRFILISERDKDIFDEFLILIAGGLGALGIEDLFMFNSHGFLKLGIALLIIMLVSTFIRKKSENKR